jgi:hypothetical protein
VVSLFIEATKEVLKATPFIKEEKSVLSLEASFS